MGKLEQDGDRIMVDVRLPAAGAIRVRWALPNAFANWKSPTALEANAAMDIADSVSWNDYDFGVESSETNDDPAITSKSNVQDRGAAQYGGSLSFYYPRQYDDNSNQHSLTYDALDTPRTLGYLLISIDGDLSETTIPTYSGGAARNFAAGDFVHVFKVMTAGYAESVTGEEAFRYTVSFLPQGELQVYTVIRATTATVTAAPATGTVQVSKSIALNGTVIGRRFTRGLRWSSSNSGIAKVSQNGVVTGVTVGSAVITATFEQTGATATSAITVTANP